MFSPLIANQNYIHIILDWSTNFKGVLIKKLKKIKFFLKIVKPLIKSILCYRLNQISSKSSVIFVFALSVNVSLYILNTAFDVKYNSVSS